MADFIGKMNLFEGRVSGVSGNQILVDAKGLGRITVPFSGSAQGEVGIAVRPEKIRLDRNEPADDRIRLRGRVTELAYYGDESAVFLEEGSGISVNVNVPNEARSTTPAFAIKANADSCKLPVGRPSRRTLFEFFFVSVTRVAEYR